MQNRKTFPQSRVYNHGNRSYTPYNNPQIADGGFNNQGNGVAPRLMLQTPQNPVHNRNMAPTAHNITHITQPGPTGLNHAMNNQGPVLQNLQGQAASEMPTVQTQQLQGQVGMPFNCHPAQNPVQSFTPQQYQIIPRNMMPTALAGVNYPLSAPNYHPICYGGNQYQQIPQQARQFAAMPPQQMYPLPANYVSNQQPKPVRATPPPQPLKTNKAITIINPDTMKPIDLSSLKNSVEKNASPPPSKESTTANTPAPDTNRATEIGAEFATRVVQAKDETNEICEAEDIEEERTNAEVILEPTSEVVIESAAVNAVDVNDHVNTVVEAPIVSTHADTSAQTEELISSTEPLQNSIVLPPTQEVQKTNVVKFAEKSVPSQNGSNTAIAKVEKKPDDKQEVNKSKAKEETKENKLPKLPESGGNIREQKQLPCEDSTPIEHFVVSVSTAEASDTSLPVAPASLPVAPTAPSTPGLTFGDVEPSAIYVTFGDLSQSDVTEAGIELPTSSQQQQKSSRNKNKKTSPVPEIVSDLPMEVPTRVVNKVKEQTGGSKKKNKNKNKAGKNKNGSPENEGAPPAPPKEKETPKAKDIPVPQPPKEKAVTEQAPKESVSQPKEENEEKNATPQVKSLEPFLPSFQPVKSLEPFLPPPSAQQKAYDAFMPSFAQAAVESQQKKRASVPDIIEQPRRGTEQPEILNNQPEDAGSAEYNTEHLNKCDGMGNTEDSVSINVARTFAKEVPMQPYGSSTGIELLGKVENDYSGQQRGVSLPLPDEDVNGNKRISYDRSFILSQQRNGPSMCKPELPNLEVVLARAHAQAYNQSFEPRMHMEQHNHGRMNFNPGRHQGGMNVRNQRQFPKKIQLNLNADTEHRNKAKDPYSLKKSKENVKELGDTKGRAVYVQKVTRSCLNKLTPENFDAICTKNFNNDLIQSLEDLRIVTEEVYEKALSELFYTELYARLCSYLHTFKDKENYSKNFRQNIIQKCQKEFETEKTEKIDHVMWEKKLAIAKATRNPEKIKTTKNEYEYEMTMLRRRAVSNINFVGELYSHKLLVAKPLISIMENLALVKYEPLQSPRDKLKLQIDVNEVPDEEKLECLCQLLTTIGKIYEEEPATYVRFNLVFEKILYIIKVRKTSSRIRFLLMDLCDLRQHQWTPRRNKEKPITKAQIKEKLINEEIQQQADLARPDPPMNRNRQDREYRGRQNHDAPHSHRPGNSSWQTAGSNHNRRVDLPTLTKTMRGNPNEVNLRPSTSFGNWGSGSGSNIAQKTAQVADTSNEQNKFQPLMPLEKPKNAPPPSPKAGGNNSPQKQGPTSYGSRSMPAPNNNNPLPRRKQNNIDRRSISSSRSNSRDSKGALLTKAEKEKESRDELERQIRAELEAYKKTVSTYDEVKDEAIKLINSYMFRIPETPVSEKADICKLISALDENVCWFVKASFQWIIDEKEDKVIIFKDLFSILATEKVLPIETIIVELTAIIEIVEDLKIDVPLVTKHLGNIIGGLVASNNVPLAKMPSLLQPAGTVKAEIFCYVMKEVCLKMEWNAVVAQVSFSNLGSIFDKTGLSILDNYDLEKLKEILEQGRKNNCDTLIQPMIDIFKQENSTDKIFKFVAENYEGDTKSSSFIRALTTSFIESFVILGKDHLNKDKVTFLDNFKGEMFDRKVRAIQKYVDNNIESELQCLFAIQALSLRYHHPKEFLMTIFNGMYYSDVITEDSIYTWVKSDEENPDKGVCVLAVTPWLKWLDMTEAETEVS